METDAAVGKILGMIMAYAVSALGLLLAYYNHRKRAGRPVPEAHAPQPIERLAHVAGAEAEGAEAGSALLRWRPWAVTAVVAAVLVLVAAAFSGDHPSATAAIIAQLPGIVVPGAVFALSFWVTWALYKRFSGGAR